MKDTIDCLLIGPNEMDFALYEKSIRKMGINSGAYRDLNLNYIRYNNRYWTVSGIFNEICQSHRDEGESDQPIHLGEVFSPAVAYLGTYLNRRGYTFDYVNAFQENKESLVEKLSKRHIMAAALTTTLYVSVLPILEIIDFIKRYNRHIKIIIGGPFVSTQVRTQEPMVVEYLFASTIDADIYINSSQGEAALVEILHTLKNDLPLDRVNNIYYKNPQGKLQATPIKKENNQLSENMVNWDLFAPDLGELAAVRTSISCPFSCAFCGFPLHAGTYQTVEPELVENQLNQLDKRGVKIINFTDDTFNVPRQRFKEILEIMVKNRYNFKWHSYYRCQYADPVIVQMMKDSGCEGVFLGLESGSDRVLKNMNKKTTPGEYLKGIELLKKQGIVTFGSFIIGFPGETPGTVQDTIEFINKSGLDFYRCQLWYCEPITPIWKQKHQYHLRGKSFEWSHDTMDSKIAFDLVDEIFLSLETPVFIPQYHFDFNGIWHMKLRGMEIEQIKRFLTGFNKGIKERLENPSAKEVSTRVIKELHDSCPGTANRDDGLNHAGEPVDRFNIKFNF
jgi:anaerobic magnesium-protoporphyrin IX monomethyl ester cyclase